MPEDDRTEGWQRGLPPGKYYDGMVDDFEVYFSPGGVKWHRRRSEIEKLVNRIVHGSGSDMTLDQQYANKRVLAERLVNEMVTVFSTKGAARAVEITNRVVTLLMREDSELATMFLAEALDEKHGQMVNRAFTRVRRLSPTPLLLEHYLNAKEATNGSV